MKSLKDRAGGVAWPIASLVIFAALTFTVILITTWVWEVPAQVRDGAQAIQAIVTVIAILGGGFLAARRLQVFRPFEPHLTVTHEISHRPVGSQYVHIGVEVILHNTSRVSISLRKAEFLLQQVSPVSDSEVELLYAQVFEDQEQKDLQWEILNDIVRTWDEGEMIVEPGEIHHETAEFIVASRVESVLIFSFFHNPKYRENSKSVEGWSATSLHDIIDQG